MKLFTLILIISNFCYASESCIPYYERKITQLEKIKAPVRGALINGSGAAIATNATLIALGVFNPVGAITAGATIAVGGGVFLTAHLIQLSLKKSMNLYNQAIKGDGRLLSKTFTRFETMMSFDQYRDLIIAGMEFGDFCKYIKRKDNYRPYRFKKVLRIIYEL